MNLFIMLLLVSFLSQAAVANDKLAETISFDTTPGQEFIDLCEALRMVCAVELNEADDKNRVPLKMKNISGREAIGAVISRYPGHSWRVHRGVLTVVPKKNVGVTPLDKQLINIDFRNQPIGTIWEFLLSSGGFAYASRAVSGVRTVEPLVPGITITARGLSSREVLTSAVKQHGSAMWQVKRVVKSGGRTVHYLEIKRYSPRQR